MMSYNDIQTTVVYMVAFPWRHSAADYHMCYLFNTAATDTGYRLPNRHRSWSPFACLRAWVRWAQRKGYYVDPSWQTLFDRRQIGDLRRHINSLEG